MLEVLGGVKLQLGAVYQGADTPKREEGTLQDLQCTGVGQTAQLRHGAKPLIYKSPVIPPQGLC